MEDAPVSLASLTRERVGCDNHDHMASSKHQSQSLCFYNLPLFDDDNLIPEIKIQAEYMQDIMLRSLISYSPYVLELMIT